MITTQLKNNDFKEYPYRYVVVATFAFIIFVHTFVLMLVPPIGYTLAHLYNVKPSVINIIPMFNYIMFAIANFPANYIIDQMGIRTGLVVGCILFCIGNGIQLLININFNSFIIGAALVGLAQPFISNCTGKIPTFWFFKQNRNGMVTLLALMNNIGAAIGYFIPNQIVDEFATGDSGKLQVFNLLLLSFSLVAFASILIFIFMRDKPQTPPSLGSQSQKTPFKESLNLILANKNFLLLTSGFVLYFSPVSTLGGLLSFLLVPYGFTNSQVSYFGVQLAVSGIVGSILVSYIVTKTLRYALVTRVVAITGVLLTILLYFSLLYFPKYNIIMPIIFFLGLFITPLYPMTIDFGCQTAFPIGQAQIQGFFSVIGSIATFSLMLIVEFSIQFGSKKQSSDIFLLFMCIGILGGIFYFMTVNDLRRRNLQEQNNQLINKLIPESNEQARMSVNSKR